MAKPYGAILYNKNITINTSSGWKYKIKKGSVVNLFIKYFGVPHLGARVRNKLLLDVIGDPNFKNERILDIGSGVGLDAFMLAEKGFDVSVSDIDKNRIHECQKIVKNSGIKNIHVYSDNIYKSKLKAKSYNRIILHQVIEHLNKPTEALKSVNALLKKGGEFYISFPSLHRLNSIGGEHFGHVVDGYDEKSFRKLIKGIGMRIVSKHSFGNSAFMQNLFYLNYLVFLKNPFLSSIFFPIIYPLALYDLKLHANKMPIGYLFKLRKI